MTLGTVLVPGSGAEHQKLALPRFRRSPPAQAKGTGKRERREAQRHGPDAAQAAKTEEPTAQSIPEFIEACLIWAYDDCTGFQSSGSSNYSCDDGQCMQPWGLASDSRYLRVLQDTGTALTKAVRR